jgi:dihydroorotate dehydrogenase (NAD+) catalytic subunit
MQLDVRLGPLQMPNPVMVASGTYGGGEPAADLIPLDYLGAFVTKSFTLHPRPGHPQPRIFETTGGLLNSIGLENDGIEEFLRHGLPPFQQIAVPLVVSIAGESQAEYLQLAAILADQLRVDALEINISCPNVEKGCLIGSDASLTRELITALRPLFPRSLIVKLTPNTSQLRQVAQAAQEAGADAIALVNTFLGMAINTRTRRSRLSRPFAGLSGPAIKPLALRLVWEVCQQVQIPVIGIGGIQTGEDAAEFLLVGARAVQVGSATFRRYDAPLRVLQELQQLLEEEGIQQIEDWIGGVRLD